ncbi:hypothetical protein JD844_019183 [Phrynosoma platyrhinos]|uniref:B box-type domain-containing protein n=1 Tax=Phrynosoma platyrhinos TaxID=52577 RepID=A0ABQ7SPH7_PHRPL|nr:hypothetical protein JD844_019183 [Phrynosoma platyrhinos]
MLTATYWFKGLKKKSGERKGPLLKSEHPTCEEHEEEKINIYCVTCAVPTCSLCKVFGEHKECEVAPLSDIYMKQKENCKAQKQALCEKFDRMSAILEERRKIMLQRITYEQENKTQHLKSLCKACSDHIESSSKLVDTALQSMEEPQMALFVQNAKVLIQKDIEDPEPTTEDEGASGEAEDPLVEFGAAAAEENTEDFFAFGNEEQDQGKALLMTETLNRAAHGVTAAPPMASQVETEDLAGKEDNLWSVQQSLLDGELSTTGSSSPTYSEGVLLSNAPIQGMDHAQMDSASGEAFSTTESSGVTEECGNQGSNEECKAGGLNGMASSSSQVRAFCVCC